MFKLIVKRIYGPYVTYVTHNDYIPVHVAFQALEAAYQNGTLDSIETIHVESDDGVVIEKISLVHVD